MKLSKIVQSIAITASLFAGFILFVNGILSINWLELTLSFLIMTVDVIISFYLLTTTKELVQEKKEVEDIEIPEIESSLKFLKIEREKQTDDILIRFRQVYNEISDLRIQITSAITSLEKLINFNQAVITEIEESSQNYSEEKDKLINYIKDEKKKMTRINNLVIDFNEISEQLSTLSVDNETYARECSVLSINAQIECSKLDIENSGFSLVTDNLSKITQATFNISTSLSDLITTSSSIGKKMKKSVSQYGQFYENLLVQVTDLIQISPSIITNTENSKYRESSIKQNLVYLSSNLLKITNLCNQSIDKLKEYMRVPLDNVK
ncbi:MAG: hypothetical protein LBV58_05180 [Acholeplasmatales bacterium]|jgi:hypothetical protein|nr:hypothetical protein [Acholeplasmatales bacterium]